LQPSRTDKDFTFEQKVQTLGHVKLLLISYRKYFLRHLFLPVFVGKLFERGQHSKNEKAGFKRKKSISKRNFPWESIFCKYLSNFVLKVIWLQMHWTKLQMPSPFRVYIHLFGIIFAWSAIKLLIVFVKKLF
jgi:hypothetical protein